MNFRLHYTKRETLYLDVVSFGSLAEVPGQATQKLYVYKR